MSWFMTRAFVIVGLLMPFFVLSQNPITQPVSPQPAARGNAPTLEQMQEWVLTSHPLADVATAVAARGPVALRQARGAYDPTVSGNYDYKTFKGSEYFSYGDAGISWQTPYALKLEAGRQWATGTFLNDERTVPPEGQAYISMKLPLLQGLITDKYRIGVLRGRVGETLNVAQAEVIRNDLRYDLAVRYAAWSYATRVLNINREAESLISTRLADTRALYEEGDKPAVDTLEARVALLNQQLVTQQATVDARVAALELQAIFWPLSLDTEPVVQSLDVALPPNELSVLGNPELAELRGLVADQELQRRLKAEYLKPQLEVGYSLLGDGFDIAPEVADDPNAPLLGRAFKFGATFRYPLGNRYARGEVDLAELKLAETAGKLEGKRRDLAAKATAYFQAALLYDQQLEEVISLATQADDLLLAERDLFGLGESTQFLLNSREQGLLKVRLTAAKLAFARAKAVYSYRAAVGVWE